MAFDKKLYNREYMRKYTKTERGKAIQDQYNLSHKDQRQNYQKQYILNNKEHIAKQTKKYKNEHREEISERRKYRKKTDPNFKITCNLRIRLNKAINNNQKSGSAVKDLGCSIEELRQYLEKQFYPNSETGEMMSWENYGKTGWHIDHVIPLSSFNLEDKEQFLKACNYTNLQPLWAKDNLEKTDKLDWKKK